MFKLVRNTARLPALGFRSHQLSVPCLELRIVPELFDHGHPGRDVAALGISSDWGVKRSGIVKTNPALPSVSGNAPRSLARTGMPLAIASIGTRPNDSRHRDGTRTARLTR